MSRDGTLACARVVHSVARNDSTLEKVLAEPALLFTPPVHAIRMRVGNPGFPESTPTAGTPTS